MKILSHQQIGQKIKRLAIEIIEQNYTEKEVILAGINNNGMGFAKLLQKELEDLSQISINLIQIKLNPAAPLELPITLSEKSAQLNNRVIIVVDDVANTGRTIFYAIKPLLEILPKKVQVAVLVDRKHKAFPIKVDYVGLSLATTTKENIDVRIRDTSQKEVHLN